jgi:MscS family membrane protein
MKTLQAIYLILLQSCAVKACIILILVGMLSFVIYISYHKVLLRLEQRSHILLVTLFNALYKPSLIFVFVLGITYALEVLCLNWIQDNINLLSLLRHLFFIALFAWFLWDFVSYYSRTLLSGASKSKTVDKTLVLALKQIAKIAIVILTALSIFQLFGLSVAGVLAFGGMGGIIIGFAAKDLLANVFGSLMLFLDRPFVIGDQIALPALKVEGQVKAIGWRVCKVLTADGRPIYVPNALFSNLVVENRSRRKFQRFSCSISLRYQDLPKVPEIIEELQTLLKKNSAIDKTRTVIVNLNELAHSSLKLLIVAYTNKVDSAEFLALQQSLYLECLTCIHRHGAQWAFQTNTVLNSAESSSISGQLQK